MPGDDLDLKFEQTLAGHLRARHVEAGKCFDAETLAAYQEGALPETQMLAAKEHIAGCERCQEIIGLSAEPVEVEQVVPWSAGENVNAAATAVIPSPNPTIIRPRSLRVSRWRWLAPAGSIAALLILWVATRNQNPVPPAYVAKNQQESAAPPPSRQNLAPSQNLAASQNSAPNESRLESSASTRKETEPVEKTRQSVRSSLPSAPPPKTSLDRDAIANTNAPASLPPSGRAYSQASMAKPAPAPAASAEAASGKVAATAANVAVAGTIAGASALQKQKKDGASTVQIASPLADVLWRVSEAGLIQHSTDAGKTWTVQASGVVVDLLAGSAPSETVCWVVGRNSTILRTTDAGEHWQRLRSPASAEISGIFATSDRQANVTAGGQVYRTTDGGQTWSVPPEAPSP